MDSEIPKHPVIWVEVSKLVNQINSNIETESYFSAPTNIAVLKSPLVRKISDNVWKVYILPFESTF